MRRLLIGITALTALLMADSYTDSILAWQHHRDAGLRSPNGWLTLVGLFWLKPGDTAWYNAGIYIFRPSLFEFTARLQKSPRGEYELTDAISALVAAHHPIAGMKIAGRWVDVRDPEVLAKLERVN